MKKIVAAASVALLAACSPMSPMSGASFNQGMLPEPVRVPAGHRVAMETVGMGDLTYECRAKADAAGAYEWVFVGPDAVLNDRAGKRVGKYYGPPATWEATDGSKVSGAQLAVAPAGVGNIPYQLVKASPASGRGAMSGVAYIQRVATRGGAAPSMACGASTSGAKQTVKYQADYIFWTAA